MYNPSTYAFLTREPVKGFLARSASRNGYGYVEGNPVNWTDPSGRYPFCAPLVIGILTTLFAANVGQAIGMWADAAHQFHVKTGWEGQDWQQAIRELDGQSIRRTG